MESSKPSDFLSVVNSGIEGSSESNQELEVDQKRVIIYDGNKRYLINQDGYKWHKYGQKALMEKNFVRSYYKCSHKKSFCSAKKCVDHSKEGPKSVVVSYIANHNHPMPEKRRSGGTSKKSASVSSLDSPPDDAKIEILTKSGYSAPPLGQNFDCDTNVSDIMSITDFGKISTFESDALDTWISPLNRSQASISDMSTTNSNPTYQSTNVIERGKNYATDIYKSEILTTDRSTFGQTAFSFGSVFDHFSGSVNKENEVRLETALCLADTEPTVRDELSFVDPLSQLGGRSTVNVSDFMNNPEDFFSN